MPKAARYAALAGERNGTASFVCLHCCSTLSRRTFYRQGHHVGACAPPPAQNNVPVLHQTGADNVGGGHDDIDIERQDTTDNSVDVEQQQSEELDDTPNIAVELFRQFLRDNEGQGGQAPNALAYIAKQGTADWYRERADHPLYDGTRLTVIEAVFLMLQVLRAQAKTTLLL